MCRCLAAPAPPGSESSLALKDESDRPAFLGAVHIHSFMPMLGNDFCFRSISTLDRQQNQWSHPKGQPTLVSAVCCVKTRLHVMSAGTG